MTSTETTGTTSAAASFESRAAARRSVRPWQVVAAAMFCVGWGGNEFTPLLSVYRERSGYSQVVVDVFLGAYVVGLIPGLLIAPMLSDRFGRRRVLVAGMLFSVVGSALIAAEPGVGSAGVLLGRMASGVAVGIAMAVGSTWVSELSGYAHDPAAGPGSGARRASIALSLGLGIGPGVAGVLAQWGPWPLTLPYLVQIALSLPVLALLVARGVETRPAGPLDGRLVDRLRVPRAAHRRFVNVVLPMAPWIFGSAGVAYAIVPQVVHDRVGHWMLIFTTVLTVATLGTGVLVQPIAKRLDSTSTARAVFVSMVLMCCGLLGAALTAATGLPVLAVVVALLLGAAYGIAVVSGLLEVQRIAPADELAGLTGVYYAIAYVGFLLPATMAALSHVVGYPTMLTALTIVAIACTGVIARGWSKHLPTG